MDAAITIRAASADDAAGMARAHVQAWRETYRGLMPDDLLDAPDAVARRERMWATAFTDPRYTGSRAVVAVREGVVIGLASAGPPLDDDADWPAQLYTLYLLAAHHGSGAGTAMLEAVLDPGDAALWVADPNPRAQAFYRKHGFVPDGVTQVERGVREIRMVRLAAPVAR